MSAYIVDRDHIRYLVSAAMSRRLNPCGGNFSWYFEGPSRGELQSDDRDKATKVGQMLWNENVLSIEGRYPDTKGKPEKMPGPGESMYVYAHSFDGFTNIDPVQVLKAANCYEYQSCEHEGWEKSEAKAVIDSIKESAIRTLTGYDDAEWEAPKRQSAGRARRK